MGFFPKPAVWTPKVNLPVFSFDKDFSEVWRTYNWGWIWGVYIKHIYIRKYRKNKAKLFCNKLLRIKGKGRSKENLNIYAP